MRRRWYDVVALYENRNPTPLWRMLDRAQWWAAAMPWTGRDEVLAQMDRTNALVTPDIAAAQNVHLLNPT